MMILSIKTASTMSLIINVTHQHNVFQHDDTQHYDDQYYNKTLKASMYTPAYYAMLLSKQVIS